MNKNKNNKNSNIRNKPYIVVAVGKAVGAYVESLA